MLRDCNARCAPLGDRFYTWVLSMIDYWVILRTSAKSSETYIAFIRWTYTIEVHLRYMLSYTLCNSSCVNPSYIVHTISWQCAWWRFQHIFGARLSTCAQFGFHRSACATCGSKLSSLLWGCNLSSIVVHILRDANVLVTHYYTAYTQFLLLSRCLLKIDVLYLRFYM